MPRQTEYGELDLLKRLPKLLRFLGNSLTLTLKHRHTSFLGTCLCTEIHQKSKQGNKHVWYTCIALNHFISLHSTLSLFKLKVKEYTTEEVAMIERATMDNAVKRAIRFEAIKIIPDHNKLIPTSFVIVCCLKTGLLLFGLVWIVLLLVF